ncbi:hypothetical protein FISHEDRAFT_56376 [Fistulina hepatica ATCC 64428]|uniref:Uncharacterized protein n=1 Tax=Fistulina hepatica ATCC 64428 TaxID=1128425 RepID=A0A0D7AKT6_9AGAR|nr:hypothetical protein FISHEDRAFT_56376 [Fistulina hepatica ATCC 64428]
MLKAAWGARVCAAFRLSPVRTGKEATLVGTYYSKKATFPISTRYTFIEKVFQFANADKQTVIVQSATFSDAGDAQDPQKKEKMGTDTSLSTSWISTEVPLTVEEVGSMIDTHRIKTYEHLAGLWREHNPTRPTTGSASPKAETYDACLGAADEDTDSTATHAWRVQILASTCGETGMDTRDPSPSAKYFESIDNCS